MRRSGWVVGLGLLMLLGVPSPSRASNDNNPPREYTKPPDTATDGKSLYVRLGGELGIKYIASDFFDRIQRDGDMRGLFIGVDMDVLKQHVAEFLSGITGGPSAYHGRDMRTAHARMKISPEDWDHTMQDLRETLNQFRVADNEQRELMGLISKMRDQIVQTENHDTRGGDPGQ